MDELERTISKGGDPCVSWTISRSTSGILVRVKVSNTIEEFFRNNAVPDEPVINVEIIGRNWKSIGDAPLQIYSCENETLTKKRRINSDNGFYRLDMAGFELLDKRSLDSPVVNLSPLRVVNASKGEGVTFAIRGVYEQRTVKETADLFGKAVRSFYSDFLKPLNISVIVSTQEM